MRKRSLVNSTNFMKIKFPSNKNYDVPKIRY